jgi:glycosyltransferase involved in cell wall biosynthesis
MTYLSIIIPVLNQRWYTDQVIREIKSKTESDYEIIIIDSISNDETQSMLEWRTDIKYIRSKENLWVNWAWNLGVSIAKWEYIAILNNDLLLSQWRDKKLIEWLKDTKLTSPIYTIWEKEWWNVYKYNRFQGDNNICWHCFVMRKSDYPVIPDDIKIWFWDNWIWNKIKWDQKTIEDCKIHHFESKTIKWDDWADDIADRIIKDKFSWVKIKDDKTINSNSVTS